MILAEKITKLRKQNNWSQEDLAEKMDVSRQSVSKWESTTSVPDLDKIIKLSQLFNVSTDYLLKDDIGDTSEFPSEKYTETFDEAPRRKLTLEEANAFMEMTRNAAARISAAVVLCILSPVPLIYMGGLSQSYPDKISEVLAGTLGTIILLLFITAAVAVFISTGMRMSNYKYISEEPFELEYGIAGLVENKLEKYQKTFSMSITCGACLCIISVIPILVSAAVSAPQFTIILCTILLFPIIAIAVTLMIRAGMIQSSYKQLLQTEDYTIQEKEKNKSIAPIASVYWLIIVAIYLGISFYYDNWNRSWIVWPSAALLYSAFVVIIKQFQSKR